MEYKDSMGGMMEDDAKKKQDQKCIALLDYN